MLFDKANIEMLKLVAQCKDFPVRNAFPEVFMLGKGNTCRLLTEGLLNTSRDGTRYRVTRAGYALLDKAGVSYPPDRYRETDAQTLRRREQSALVSLTLLLAGVDVYGSDVAQMGTDTYLSGGSIRRMQRASGRNLTGNTRFAGLTTGFIFYYATDPQDVLYYKQETRIAHALRAQSRSCTSAGTRPAVVYMGADYPTLCSMVTLPANGKANFRTAYDKFSMPVHLCPCTPEGAFQMRVMLQDGYRERLIDGLLESSAPNPLYPGCDGMREDGPFVLGVDMDLRRITGMIQAARNGGVEAHIFAFRQQGEALRKLFPDINIKFYAISADDVRCFSIFRPSLQSRRRRPMLRRKAKPSMTKPSKLAERLEGKRGTQLQNEGEAGLSHTISHKNPALNGSGCVDGGSHGMSRARTIPTANRASSTIHCARVSFRFSTSVSSR